MPPLVTTQPTWPSTGPELPGTAPKPSPPPPTWSPSSGASSSPPNIGQVTPANRPQQKSMPSSWPGMQQRHNRESRVAGRGDDVAGGTRDRLAVVDRGDLSHPLAAALLTRRQPGGQLVLPGRRGFRGRGP